MITVFDLETQRLSTDIGPDGKPIGWSLDRRGLMEISWGCCCCSLSKDQWFMHHFDWDDLERLASKIERSDLIVSYNGISFDIPLLESVLGRKIMVKAHCDLILPTQKVLGYRLPMKDLAEGNLGISKSGYSCHAPQLFRDGKYGALAEYCARDVEITRDLFLLALEQGYLLSTDGTRIEYSMEFLRGRNESK